MSSSSSSSSSSSGLTFTPSSSSSTSLGVQMQGFRQHYRRLSLGLSGADEEAAAAAAAATTNGTSANASASSHSNSSSGEENAPTFRSSKDQLISILHDACRAKDFPKIIHFVSEFLINQLTSALALCGISQSPTIHTYSILECQAVLEQLRSTSGPPSASSSASLSPSPSPSPCSSAPLRPLREPHDVVAALLVRLLKSLNFITLTFSLRDVVVADVAEELLSGRSAPPSSSSNASSNASSSAADSPAPDSGAAIPVSAKPAGHVQQAQRVQPFFSSSELLAIVRPFLQPAARESETPAFDAQRPSKFDLVVQSFADTLVLIHSCTTVFLAHVLPSPTDAASSSRPGMTPASVLSLASWLDDEVGKHGYRALHYLAEENCFRGIALLLQLGASPMVKDNDSNTPLHFAAQHNFIESVMLLVNAGADITAYHGWRITPLHYAAQRGKSGVVLLFMLLRLKSLLYRRLLHHHTTSCGSQSLDGPALPMASTRATDSCCPLGALLAESRDVKKLPTASEFESRYWSSTLPSFSLAFWSTTFIASWRVIPEISVSPDIPASFIQRLYDSLDIAPSVNIPDNDQSTPLIWAAETGQEENLRFLVGAGASVNAVSRFGQTALSAACFGSHTRCVQYLLSHGASVAQTSRQFSSPLHTACDTNNAEIVQLLLEHGADPTVAAEDGTLPIHLAAANTDAAIVTMLLNQCQSDDARQLQLQTRAGLYTPLELACFWGHLAVAETLIHFGARVNFTPEEEQASKETGSNIDPPIHQAIASGIGDTRMIRLLVEKGASINVMSSSGLSVLTAAVKRGLVYGVEFLLTTGVWPVNARLESQIALSPQYASERIHPNVVRCLEIVENFEHSIKQSLRTLCMYRIRGLWSANLLNLTHRLPDELLSELRSPIILDSAAD